MTGGTAAELLLKRTAGEAEDVSSASHARTERRRGSVVSGNWIDGAGDAEHGLSSERQINCP